MGRLCPRVLGVAQVLPSRYKSVKGAGAGCKTCDKPINFIDRVIGWILEFLYFLVLFL
jgi:hypothetical protein